MEGKDRRDRNGAPVLSEGAWLSTGNTVMWRSYTGRLSCRCVPTGFLPSALSVPPSEITKVMVSWRGVRPISSPKSIIIKAERTFIGNM